MLGGHEIRFNVDTQLAIDFQPSNITSKTFVAANENLRARQSNMPIIVFDTLGQGIPATTSNELRRTGVAVIDVNQATGSAAIENGIIEDGERMARLYLENFMRPLGLEMEFIQEKEPDPLTEGLQLSLKAESSN